MNSIQRAKAIGELGKSILLERIASGDVPFMTEEPGAGGSAGISQSEVQQAGQMAVISSVHLATDYYNYLERAIAKQFPKDTAALAAATAPQSTEPEIEEPEEDEVKGAVEPKGKAKAGVPSDDELNDMAATAHPVATKKAAVKKVARKRAS